MPINKKGILLEEGIKLIIAILCIALLVLAGTKIFSIVRESKEIKQAKASLEEIKIKMKNMESGQEIEHIIYVPDRYALIGWPIKEKENEYITTQCEKQIVCLCLCPLDNKIRITNLDYLSTKERIIKTIKDTCDSKGVCIGIKEAKEIRTTQPNINIIKSSGIKNNEDVLEAAYGAYSIFLSSLREYGKKIKIKKIGDKYFLETT